MDAPRHLPSALGPLTCLWIGVPWRSFTMSRPLQPSVGLLRRLCPPFHALAFLRPITGQGGVGVPQFQSMMWLQSVAAPYTPDALWSNPGPHAKSARQASSLLGRACQPVTPVYYDDASEHFRGSPPPNYPQTGVPLVSIDRKGSAISPVWLGDFAHCQRASHPRSCRDRTHAAYPSRHYSYAALNEQHHRLLKGALAL
jgi:hypothetical protein